MVPQITGKLDCPDTENTSVKQFEDSATSLEPDTEKAKLL